jgi:methionine sulfoxide reductase heme-binding subunit
VAGVAFIWPWQAKGRQFSWLKAGAFAFLFVPGAWLIYQVETGEFGPVPLGGMTYWSGLSATGFLLLALAITPVATITGWSRLILVRRMIGVTALAYTIAHIFIYFALRFWSFASITHEMLTRISLILAAFATLGLIALAATSLDEAIRRMGAKGWQRLHNAIYVTAALAVIHYLLSPDSYSEQYLVSGIFFWLMGWRVLKSRGWGIDPLRLTALAAGSSLFTAVLEAGWTWAYHDYEPSWTIGNNFNLDLGVSPAWKVLMLGLLMAGVAFARRVARIGSAKPPASVAVGE